VGTGGGSAGGAAGTFAMHVDFVASEIPYGLALADFNADGKLDIADVGVAVVAVRLNTTAPMAATPTFSSAFNFPHGANGGAATGQRIAIGDLNQDGKPDIVAATNSTWVTVLLNTTPAMAATPTFAAGVDLTTSGSTWCAAVADFNADGKLDVAVCNGNAGTSTGWVSVFLSTTAAMASSASFMTKVDLQAGDQPYDVVATDMNQDGKPDVVVTDYAGAPYGVRVMLNTTAASATTPTFAGGGAAQGNCSVAVGDFNADGKTDLVSSNFPMGAYVSLNSTTTGASNLTFASPQMALGPQAWQVAVGDFDRDGRPDFVVADSQSKIRVYRNITATGATMPAFVEPELVDTPSSTFFVTAGDLNSDGRLDLVTGNPGGTISVLLASPP
jgi:hypothetical protein